MNSECVVRKMVELLSGAVLARVPPAVAVRGEIAHSSSTQAALRAGRQPRSGSAVRHYASAAAFVAVSFILTFALQPFFPYPFLFFFFGAVVAGAWFGGTKPGLFSVVISTLIVEYFFVPPFYSFAISPTSEAYFGAFVVCALIASWVSSSKKQTEEALREARDKLEFRVSERTAALMKTQGELAHLSRMLSMAELTASIVHEIGQPLTGVVTNGQACIEWLSSEPPNTDRARQTVDNIVRDGTRAGAVLGRIRALFKKEPPAKEWLNINEVVEELAIFLLDEARRREVHIQTHLAHDLPKVKADRVQLQQVMLNLIVNAMDAMSESASVTRKVVISSERNDHKEIVIRVEDCGVGLQRETAEKIFDPFFTTKPHGIGMGLSISRSIVESHNGRIWASSCASGGAVFEFTIPLAARDPDD